jgi:hypothetical protein
MNTITSLKLKSFLALYLSLHENLLEPDTKAVPSLFDDGYKHI